MAHQKFRKIFYGPSIYALMYGPSMLFYVFRLYKYYFPNLTPTVPSFSKLLVEIKLTCISIFTFLCSISKRLYEDLYERHKGMTFEGPLRNHKEVWSGIRAVRDDNIYLLSPGFFLLKLS